MRERERERATGGWEERTRGKEHVKAAPAAHKAQPQQAQMPTRLAGRHRGLHERVCLPVGGVQAGQQLLVHALHRGARGMVGKQHVGCEEEAKNSRSPPKANDAAQPPHPPGAEPASRSARPPPRPPPCRATAAALRPAAARPQGRPPAAGPGRGPWCAGGAWWENPQSPGLAARASAAPRPQTPPAASAAAPAPG